MNGCYQEIGDAGIDNIQMTVVPDLANMPDDLACISGGDISRLNKNCPRTFQIRSYICCGVTLLTLFILIVIGLDWF